MTSQTIVFTAPGRAELLPSNVKEPGQGQVLVQLRLFHRQQRNRAGKSVRQSQCEHCQQRSGCSFSPVCRIQRLRHRSPAGEAYSRCARETGSRLLGKSKPISAFGRKQRP